MNLSNLYEVRDTFDIYGAPETQRETFKHQSSQWDPNSSQASPDHLSNICSANAQQMFSDCSADAQQMLQKCSFFSLPKNQRLRGTHQKTLTLDVSEKNYDDLILFETDVSANIWERLRYTYLKSYLAYISTLVRVLLQHYLFSNELKVHR